MMEALVRNGIVVEVQKARFPVHPDFTWLAAPAEAQIGWLLVDGVLEAPPVPVVLPLPDVGDIILSAGDRLTVLEGLVGRANGTTLAARQLARKQEKRDAGEA